jgi:hypothetical protein
MTLTEQYEAAVAEKLAIEAKLEAQSQVCRDLARKVKAETLNRASNQKHKV